MACCAPAVSRRRGFDKSASRPLTCPRPPWRRAPQTAELRRGSALHTLIVQPGETLLEAGLRAGATMPFSCTMGGCGACKVKLDSGQVTHQEPNCLTAEERAAGYILACVASPCTKVAVELP